MCYIKSPSKNSSSFYQIAESDTLWIVLSLSLLYSFFRYEYLYRTIPADETKAGDFCLQVLKEEFEATKVEDYQLGTSKLFLKEAFYQHLEQQRLDVSLYVL